MDNTEQIKELEEELRVTKYNKRTQHHIGLVKAKIARLKEQRERRSKQGVKVCSVRKSGDASVSIIGFPSVGKSTLLNILTNAKSKVAAYEFTTLTAIPGLMHYNNANIQLLDLPGVIGGAAKGIGRGREVFSMLRITDLVLILVDVNHPEHYSVLKREIRNAGLRLNRKRPDVRIKKTAKDGIRVGFTVRPTKIDETTIKLILKEFKLNNAEVLIREDINIDEFIDCLEDNKVYAPSLVVLSKIDTVSKGTASGVSKKINADIAISAEKDVNIDKLKEMIYDKLGLINIFLKQPGKKADFNVPLIMEKGCTIGNVCEKLHKDFINKFKFVRIWNSKKFSGQKLLRLEHRLDDGDVLEIHLK
ncbi:GTP-binding protein [Candidatus Woesearchaeota archaeon]|nr:GTP-binding protein [Candidatus Woesearchaeota archaeon]|tara:strand:+ start:12661 stop:13746 length:1086 start_codon:yes stop_codon:yes gene_type:complete